MSLRELYRQHEEAWEAFVAIPWERREFGKPHDNEVEQIEAKLESLTGQIDEHPDARDFEADFREVFAKPDETKAAELWSALANIDWEHEHGSRYSASFRYAGGLIAEMREEDGSMAYMNWYCSGPYATVSDEIAEALAARGWTYKELG